MKIKAAKDKVTVPHHYEDTIKLITANYASFSESYKRVARFFTQNPNIIALESIHSIATEIDVNPSTVVRFAQSLGYSGFRELQSMFQTRLATVRPGFRERVSARDAEIHRIAAGGNLRFLHNMVAHDVSAIWGLLEVVTEEALESAAGLCAGAETIYVAGQLRSEPIAELVHYLMTMLQRKVILLNSASGLSLEIASNMKKGDVIIGVSFRHYAKEVVLIAEYAVTHEIPLIAITDSELSPLAKGAAVLFAIQEEEYSFSQSLAAPMSLVQALAIATAARLQPKAGVNVRIPTVTEIARDQALRFLAILKSSSEE
jgi:DNA-binding MurR/RpiR family transcriptional regulator